MNEAKTDYSKYILPVGGLLLLIGAGQKFGLLPSADSEKNKQKAGDAEKFLNRDYLQKLIKGAAAGTKTKLLKQADAQHFAESIHDTKHLLKNNKVRLVSIFKTIPYRSQVSQVAEKFYSIYGEDLFTWLRDNYSDEILAAIFDAINTKEVGQ